MTTKTKIEFARSRHPLDQITEATGRSWRCAVETDQATAAKRSISVTLASLVARAAGSTHLLYETLDNWQSAGRDYTLPRFVFIGPKGGGDPIPLGLFAGIYGDEPQTVFSLVHFLKLLTQDPGLAEGFLLYVYPICNPTGFEDRTRESRGGADLNLLFWRDSDEAEVRVLEQEILAHRFYGLISLEADRHNAGMYGYVRGATLTRHLLEPALAAADQILPRNHQPVIDGLKARDGVIRAPRDNGLGASPRLRPRPFEMILKTPQQAPAYQQEQALSAALLTILAEYRKLMAYANYI